ncbi:PLP-dependent transferase [Myriangium duriaei CBS 260.36]|uniref:PLP-dependent transferase n=1 Tax=Myriangium duriaei CBS 260.36 TaxID=1168546 RepID=A0A9P4IUY9_9PEZI|nr:PLP-dependent transferase [Myriangium duriaei CBS 260.36]
MISHESPRRTIDLLKGHPSVGLLPARAISDAAQTVLSDTSISTPGLLYGADEGYGPFRQAIADWHSSFYGRSVSKDNIVISGGASQNLACVLQVFSDPLYTQNVWISSPAYMLVFRMFQDNGFADKMRAVPEVHDGIDVDWLERELQKASKESKAAKVSSNMKPKRSYSKYYRHIIYCVPTFSNPSSSIMPIERRRALVRCARKYDALIITDDVYDHLQWSTEHIAENFHPITSALVPRLVDVDAELEGGCNRPGSDGFGNAMSNGSFSKIVAPGCRCGWAEGSPKLVFGVSQVGSSRSGGCPSQLVSTFLAELLTSGRLQDNIFNTLQPEYAARYRVMADALQEHAVPLGCTMSVPDKHMGGYFIWLALPKGLSGDELTALCKAKEDLIIMAGSQCEVPSEDRISHDGFVRLCFAWEEKDMLAEGVRRLATVLKKLKESY